MALLSEARHAGEFVLQEMHSFRSRLAVTLLSGQNLLAGAVLGRVSLGVGRITAPAITNAEGSTANGTITQVFAGPDVEEGSYVIECTVEAANNGTFTVTAPSGKVLPNAVMAAGACTYRSSHINFVLTDGSEDFNVGDKFTCVVDTTAPAIIATTTANGTVSSITLGPDAKPGNYRLECVAAVTNGGHFKLIGPDGDQVGNGFIVAGASGTLVLANQRQLNLTITDGANDFAVGDAFNITVFNKGERGKGKVVAWDPTAVDGRQRVAGVLVGAVDATSSDLPGMALVKDAIVISDLLSWGAAISAAQKEVAKTEMARELNITVR